MTAVYGVSFESTVDGWASSGTDGTVSITSEAGTTDGVRTLKMLVNTGLGSGTVQTTPTATVAASASTQYTFRVDYRQAAGSGNNVTVGVRWISSNGNVISTSSSTTVVASQQVWYLKSVTATSPANTVAAQFFVTVVGGSGTTYYLDAAGFNTGTDTSYTAVAGGANTTVTPTGPRATVAIGTPTVASSVTVTPMIPTAGLPVWTATGTTVALDPPVPAGFRIAARVAVATQTPTTPSPGATPGRIVAVVAIPAPAKVAPSNVGPIPPLARAAMPTPTITPAQQGYVGLGPPTITATATVTPTTAATVSFPAVGVSITKTQAVLAAVTAIQAPTVSAVVTVVPATVSAAVAVATPGETATANPAVTVAAFVAVSVPAVGASAGSSPTAAAAVAAIATPTVTAAAGTAAKVAAVAAVPTPTIVKAADTPTPAPVVATVTSLAVPGVTADATVTPAAVAAVAAVATPTVTAGATVAPTPVAAVGALAVTPLAPSNVTPTVLSAVATVSTPTLDILTPGLPAVVAAVAAAAIPAVQTSATATPAPLETIVAVGVAPVVLPGTGGTGPQTLTFTQQDVQLTATSPGGTMTMVRRPTTISSPDEEAYRP